MTEIKPIYAVEIDPRDELRVHGLHGSRYDVVLVPLQYRELFLSSPELICAVYQVTTRILYFEEKEASMTD